MTDVRLSYVEQKTPGTKRVEALRRIGANACADGLLAPMPQEMTAQSEFPFSSGDEEYLEEIKSRFGLSGPQVSGLRGVAAEHGIDYIKAKVEIVTNMEPDNGARTLLAAVRDDWPAPKKVRKPGGRPSPVIEPPALTPEEKEAFRLKVLEEGVAFREEMKLKYGLMPA